MNDLQNFVPCKATALGLALLLFTGCGTGAAPPPSEREKLTPLSFAGLSPGDEFRQVAERIRKTRNRFHGREQTREIEQALASDSLSAAERCGWLGDQAMDRLRLGQIDGAIESIEAALRMALAQPDLRPMLADLHRIEAIVYLRQAEQVNCISAHCAQSCIFPIERGGVHHHREAALRARLACERLLRLTASPPVETVWLLNILAMTLGEFPEKVPPALRLPGEKLTSEAEVGEFVDIADPAGVNRLGIAGGVIADDFDGDGRIDLVASSAAPDDPLRFYHNTGDGTFVERSHESGLDEQLGGLQCQSVDYNNDGLPDICVQRGGWFYREGGIRKSLLKNNGDGTFSDVTRAAGLADPAYPSQAGVWADLDNDGDLDFYQVNESLIERGADVNFPAQLYRNNGDGTFTDVAAQAGVTNDRYAKGVAAGDYDNDGDLDLFVSNYHYFEDPQFGRNRLYRNNGDGTFSDVAEALNLTHPLRGFAAWWFDYDNDGWLDLWVSAYEALLADVVADYRPGTKRDCRLRLYRNRQGEGFDDVTVEAGLDGAFQTMGASFGDLDNDGWLDVYLGTGGQYYDWLVPNVLFRNDGGKRFQNATTSAGMGHLQKGHGIVFADLDNDGDQDVYACLGGFYPGDRFTNCLFCKPGHGGRFLKLQLVGARSNRRGVGARIAVTVATPSGSRRIFRCHGLGSSFGGLPPREEIGLGDATAIERVMVEWPSSATRQEFSDVPLDRLIEIREGDAPWREIPLERIDFEQHVRAARTP